MSLGTLSLRAGHHAPEYLPFLAYMQEEVERQGGTFVARKGSAQVIFNKVRYVLKRSRAHGTIKAHRWGDTTVVATEDVVGLYGALRGVRRADEYVGVVLRVRKFVRAMRLDSEAQ